MPLYTEKQRQAVLKRAVQAVQARVSGKKSVTLGSGGARQTFDLEKGGMCGRFVRQVFETALGLSPFSWYFGAARACYMLKKLKPYEVPLSEVQAGDILGFNGNPGHIAIYIGGAFDPNKKLTAENTISGKRGYPQKPGTKVSSLTDQIKQHGWTKAYRLFPTAK